MWMWGRQSWLYVFLSFPFDCFFFFFTEFSPLFVIFYHMDKSFYLKITFIQTVILPNYGIIIQSTFDLLKQPLIIRNVQLHFWQKLFF